MLLSIVCARPRSRHGSAGAACREGASLDRVGWARGLRVFVHAKQPNPGAFGTVSTFSFCSPRLASPLRPANNARCRCM